MRLQSFLLVLILVVIFLSFIICLVFVFLNRWLFRQGKRILRLDRKPEHNIKGQRYQARNIQSAKLSTPALPSRAQFITEAQRKLQTENLNDEPDYEDPDKNVSRDFEQDSCVQRLRKQPDYVKVESEPDAPSYGQNIVIAAQSYENLADDYVDPDKNGTHDYEQDSYVHSPPESSDYVKVESEPDAPPHVPEAQSYENLADEQNYEEPEQNYEEPEQDYEDPEQNYEEPEQDYEDPEQDYEDPDKNGSHDYEQDSYVEPSNYMKVESEPDAASYEEPGDTASTEDYDDIGTEDSEDYDDVG